MGRRSALPPFVERGVQKISNVCRDWRNVGLHDAFAPRLLEARYRLLELAGKSVQGKLIRYRVSGTEYPVYGRYGTTDAWAFHQVFIDREFDPLARVSDIRLVVDCGANVGYASFWFLNQFPQAQVIAIEPDSANFAVCARNLQPFADRVSLHNSGVWSRPVGLRIHRRGDPTFDFWTLQVRDVGAEERPDIMATSISMLLNESGLDRIDILKVDIEGSEAIVFASEPHAWLSKVRHLVIELHEDPCAAVFFDAMSHYDYDLLKIRELVFCMNIRPRDNGIGCTSAPA